MITTIIFHYLLAIEHCADYITVLGTGSDAKFILCMCRPQFSAKRMSYKYIFNTQISAYSRNAATTMQCFYNIKEFYLWTLDLTNFIYDVIKTTRLMTFH